jgi:hypothetical protein
MNEDPIARRNRGGGYGVWILLGLGLLVVVLIAAVMLKPAPAQAPLDAAPAAVSMEQRVAADTVDRQKRDAARAEAKRP